MATPCHIISALVDQIEALDKTDIEEADHSGGKAARLARRVINLRRDPDPEVTVENIRECRVAAEATRARAESHTRKLWKKLREQVGQFTRAALSGSMKGGPTITSANMNGETYLLLQWTQLLKKKLEPYEKLQNVVQ
eukprot:1862055-Pyramimonas_sp.AAC.1